jgi:hypothetical protein
MQEFVIKHLREIIALVVPFLVWGLNIWHQGRPRLVRSIRHAFTFLIQEPLRNVDGEILRPSQTVQTASVSVVNTGRIAATKIEVVFNWKPQYLNMWPSRHYEEKVAPDGRYSVIYDSLPAKDSIGFELLAINADLPQIITVRSEQVVAVERNLSLQPVYPRSALWLSFWLMLSGLAINVYGIASIIQLLGNAP